MSIPLWMRWKAAEDAAREGEVPWICTGEHTIYDDKHRILSPAKGVHQGHSVCNDCEIDMPKCWDVVCSVCWRTFCYRCSKSDGHYWYCEKCWKERGK